MPLPWGMAKDVLRTDTLFTPAPEKGWSSSSCQFFTTSKDNHLQSCEDLGRTGTYLVTDEPIEFEKQPVEVQNCRKITDHFEKNLWNIPQFNEGKPKDVNI